MILISHRGNLDGPSNSENHPDQIKKVLGLGYDCEIDLWYEFGKFFLGHDIPEYFWHERDSYTLTSKNFIWTFPNKLVVEKSVIVDNNKKWRSKDYDCYGVCSDYIL